MGQVVQVHPLVRFHWGSHKQSGSNQTLVDKRLKAEKALLEIEDDINNKTADELKEIIIAKLFPHKAKAEKQKRFGLYEFTNKIIK